MYEWLDTAVSSTLELSAAAMALRLALAFISGLVIAGIYWLVRRRDLTATTFPPTLVLLSILCAILPQIIGENVAWAFGLVGALSIVRFRTVVEDTQDITFVIFAVLVGMAVGAGRLPIAMIGIGVVGAAAFIVQPRGGANPWSDANSKLSIRVGVGRDPDAIVQAAFERYLTRFDLVAGATGRQGAAIDLTYRVRLRPSCSPTRLIEELNRVEGVQSVELRGE